MDMSMPTSGSNATTTTSSVMMTMSQMAMTFYTSSLTPLYSTAWSPTSTGSYAGTCIFLIVLAALLRGLLALRGWKEAAWLDAEFNRRYVVVAGKQTKAERVLANSSESKRMILTENGVEEDVVVVKKRSSGVRPWRLSVEPIRAAIDTLIAGVAYLLMLAVMTMNVGYFMAVLGGTFLGSLIIGRYTAAYEHNH